MRACIDAGVAPRFENFEGTRVEALEIVRSLNIVRRHLNESQRAIVAGKFWKARKLVRRQAGKDSANLPKLSQSEVAQAFNISPRSLGKAVRLSENKTLIAEVAQGRISLDRAVRKSSELPGLGKKASMLPVQETFEQAANASAQGYADTVEPKQETLEPIQSLVDILGSLTRLGINKIAEAVNRLDEEEFDNLFFEVHEALEFLCNIHGSPQFQAKLRIGCQAISDETLHKPT